MTNWVIFATCGVIGLLVGSFLNVVIHRGPSTWGLLDDLRGNLITPRSHCPACKTPIRLIHLIPILGFVSLGGKCAACDVRIAVRYPVVEILGAIAPLAAVCVFGLSVSAIFASFYLWSLIALAFIDAETGYLPDALTLPLISMGLIANGFGLFVTWPNALIGATTGYVAFQIIAMIFLRIRGMEGLGQGDAKMLAAFGAWLGWLALAPIVFAGAVLALLAITAFYISGRRITADTPIPFGPSLAVAGAFALLAAGLEIPSNYWR